MVKISVLITDYKNPLLTKLCVESLKLTTFKDKEVLVRSDSKYNIGLAASSNLLAKRAKGEYLFFLNNDTLVKRDIFERLLKSPYDLTGCRMYDYRGKIELDSALSLDRFGCPAGKTGKVFYCDGAIFIKKTVFDEIGGFDEKLFLYGEDRDLFWRGHLAGYRVGYCPSAVFYHNSDSVNSTGYARRYHSEKNIIRTMLKNYTLASLARFLPQYALWSALELILIVFTNPKAIAKSYLRAYWWNIKNLKDTIEKRMRVIHRIPDSKLPFSNKIGKLNTLFTKGIPKWRK